MSATATRSLRRFARYRPTERIIQGRRFWSIPEGGLCLSAFLILRDESEPERVLLGRPNPAAPWPFMASLESEHLSTLGDRWLLPASHLIEFESPQDAARRIAREQLGLERPELDGPRVFSETYPSAIDPASGAHWDVHFVFEGKWPSQNRPAAPVWRELNLLDCERLSRNEIGRGHADVLALVGLRLRG